MKLFVLLLVLLPLVQQQQALTLDDAEENEFSSHSRNKRDIISYICPKSAAAGNDIGQRSKIIFRSPTERRDIIIDFRNGSWGDENLTQLIGFNNTRRTILYSHGFHQSGNKTWLMNARSIYDELNSKYTNNSSPLFNLFIFDWAAYSDYGYGTSVSYVPHLGKILGQFLEKLNRTQSYDMDKFHIIGYSLSTHIAGIASRYMANNGAPLGQLTALDPTGVCLHHDSLFSDKNGLRSVDANLVVARHYNMDGFGSKRPIGGLDIFVNGGKLQPNPPMADRYGLRYKRDTITNDDTDPEDEDKEFDDNDMVVMARSDHHRATEHEVQAIDEQCHDMAYECSSYEAYLRGECADCGPDGLKCYFVSNFKQLLAEERGEQYRPKIFYPPGTRMFLKTHYQDPFCLHHYQMLAELSANSTTDATKKLLSSGAIEFILDNKETVKLNGPIDGNKFTALISSVKKIEKLEGMILKVNANNSAFKAFLDSLDHMEMNYMSHPLAEERAKASYRLCLDESRSSLIKCNQV